METNGEKVGGVWIKLDSVLSRETFFPLDVIDGLVRVTRPVRDTSKRRKKRSDAVIATITAQLVGMYEVDEVAPPPTDEEWMVVRRHVSVGEGTGQSKVPGFGGRRAVSYLSNLVLLVENGLITPLSERFFRFSIPVDATTVLSSFASPLARHHFQILIRVSGQGRERSVAIPVRIINPLDSLRPPAPSGNLVMVGNGIGGEIGAEALRCAQDHVLQRGVKANMAFRRGEGPEGGVTPEEAAPVAGGEAGGEADGKPAESLPCCRVTQPSKWAHLLGYLRHRAGQEVLCPVLEQNACAFPLPLKDRTCQVPLTMSMGSELKKRIGALVAAHAKPLRYMIRTNEGPLAEVYLPRSFWQPGQSVLADVTFVSTTVEKLDYAVEIKDRWLLSGREEEWATKATSIAGGSKFVKDAEMASISCQIPSGAPPQRIGGPVAMRWTLTLSISYLQNGFSQTVQWSAPLHVLHLLNIAQELWRNPLSETYALV